MAATALINIDVDDLERAVAFYVAGLGLRVGRKLGPSVVELLGSDAPIHLLEKAAGSPAAATAECRRYLRHWTPVHLDFVVAELEVAIREAVAADATLEAAPVTHSWGRIAQLADPFGHGLCVIQFVARGYDEITGD